LNGRRIGSWTWACGRSTDIRNFLALSEKVGMYRARKSPIQQFWHFAIPDNVDVGMAWRSRERFGLEIVLDRVGPIHT
jgi:hypothetical protein